MKNLIEISRALAREVDALSFAPPVAYVYNPLDYAREPAEEYLRRYGAAPKEVVLLGMNPGPYGMVQVGVPFGEVTLVHDWLGIRGTVGKPPREHPKRPVDGFACKRHEASGARLWGWAKARFGTPEQFFARFFVVNYCPLAFFDEGGQNRTPDKLPIAERQALYAVCDRALRRTIELLTPRYAIGIGDFATKRLQAALEGIPVTLGTILHPSPANPQANRGWALQVDAALAKMGILE